MYLKYDSISILTHGKSKGRLTTRHRRSFTLGHCSLREQACECDIRYGYGLSHGGPPARCQDYSTVKRRSAEFGIIMGRILCLPQLPSHVQPQKTTSLRRCSAALTRP